ncbi:monofunctional biosynthetic peptidoglycan transglycosylase [Polymorphobacter multimanifer]|uniref:Biosynthetic peptidoglycan transglycosylase n=1 Tax=Polymorphobacter multimanifer TaxID=1070431 RepID=A0A841L5T2_9SPHN|nr:monofunctional biosynthetic peptidoglycan transglycosylase [Polymorphobacter multimanifer]MBB6227957.1 monofunctional biosynthetic peptidoglycan transglycosylase [Polymorphobacter multimanifer]GGI84796.1 monofunctional biosynthetic peptidoglycan transglycosylase [Polymorphobacter multimanifer]
MTVRRLPASSSRTRKGGFRQRPIGWLFSLLAKLVMWFVILSLGWVLAYRFIPVPVTWPMARDMLQGRHVERDWTPLAEMAKVLPRAVIGAEDGTFCAHRGFDVEAMKQAATRNAEGERLRGGSTISQQTAKNAFLWPGRSYVRKGLEAWFTLLIELIWGKPRIMEVYLNIAEMGPGVYGAQAAAKHHFGSTADRLTAQQAARLAAILPQPIKRKAGTPGPFVRRYSRAIEKRIRVVANSGFDSCLR